MPRARFTKAVVRRVSGAPADGQVAVYEPGTTTPVVQTLYAADTGVGTLANPFAFTGGQVDFFLDLPQRVRLDITPSGGAVQVFDKVDVPAPAQPYELASAGASQALRELMLPGVDSSALPLERFHVAVTGSDQLLVPAATAAGKRRVVKSLVLSNNSNATQTVTLAYTTVGDILTFTVPASAVVAFDLSLVQVVSQPLTIRGGGTNALSAVVTYTAEFDASLYSVQRFGALQVAQTNSNPAFSTLVTARTPASAAVVRQVTLSNPSSGNVYAHLRTFDGTTSKTIVSFLLVPASSTTVVDLPLRLETGETLQVANFNTLSLTGRLDATAHGYTV